MMLFMIAEQFFNHPFSSDAIKKLGQGGLASTSNFLKMANDEVSTTT